MSRRGVAFSPETGLAQYVEVRAVEPIAVDGATVCRLAGYEPSHATLARLRTIEGFPTPIAPAGGDRWLLEELRVFFSTLCPRAATRRTWSAARRAKATFRATAREEARIQ